MRVVDCIRHHLGWQRPPRPVRFLRSLGKIDVVKSFDQRGQTELANTNQASRDHCVKNLPRNKMKAPPQQSEIEIRTVQNDFLVRQRLAKRGKIDFFQRIDDKIPWRHADLQQAKLFSITMKTVGLGIERDARFGVDFRKQLRQLRNVRDHFSRFVVPGEVEESLTVHRSWSMSVPKSSQLGLKLL